MMSAFKIRPVSKSSALFFVIFIFLILGVMCSGVFAYRSLEKNYRIQAEQQLSSIAELKSMEIQQWKNERIGDAEILSSNLTFSKLVEHYFKNPEDKKTVQQLMDWLSEYPKNYDYSHSSLIATGGMVRFSYPSNESSVSLTVLNHIPEMLITKKVTFIDFYRHEKDHQIYLTMLVPILDSTPKKSVVGIVSLRINPEKYLYPILLRWPTVSETGESLLIRREGDYAVFLNEAKGRANSALNFKVPLSSNDIPAVMAVMGKTGIVEGVDYRYLPAIADLRSIPNSPWFLEAHMNLNEVYLPLRSNLWMLIGAVLGMIVSTVSILYVLWRKQIQAVLQKNEERYRGLLTNLDAAVVVHAPDTSLVMNNPKASELLGLSSDQMKGKLAIDPEWRFVNEDGSPLPVGEYPVNKIAKNFQSIKNNILGINRPLKKDVVWVSVNGYPAFKSNGEIDEIVISFIDITEIKKAADALLAAKKAADDVAESKSKFLDIAAHELRTPITVLTLVLQIAQKQLENGQTVSPAMIERLKRPAERLSRLVIELLDVSRLERGLFVLKPEQTDICKIASECVDEFHLLFPERAIAFLPCENSIEMRLDPLRIHEVISNLIDNAIKYTSPEVPIEVVAELIPNAARVSVIDHGKGISPDQQKNLFAAFTRGDSDENIRTSGLGLGLSVCSGIIALHGGTINVLSEPGRGSTFYFEIPRKA